jgi:hypothetical protein
MSKKNLEKDLSDLKNKISSINEENESQIKLLNDSKKDIINNYEKQINELKNRLNKIQTNQIETEDKLKTQEQLVEFEKMGKEEIKIKYENEIKELLDKFDLLKNKSENDMKRNNAQLEMKENIIQKLFSHQKELENESENKIKEKQEKINQKAMEIEKLYSQEKQQNEFLQEQNKDLISQVTQLKKNQAQILDMLNLKNENGNNDLIINLLGDKNDPSENANSIIETKLRNIRKIITTNSIDFNDDDFKRKNDLINIKVENISKSQEINKSHENLDNDNISDDNNYNNENNIKSKNNFIDNIIDSSSKKTIEDLTKRLNEYKKELDMTQDIRNNFNVELRKQTKDIINDYENQLILKEENHRNEIKELNNHSEDTLNQLKTIFNDEKTRLESKLLTQKKKI